MNLDTRTRELIAIGASITANCQPCLEYHVAKAMESGAGEQEISEAIEVGKLVRQGAALKMDKFAPSVVERPPCAAAPSGDRECGGGS